MKKTLLTFVKLCTLKILLKIHYSTFADIYFTFWLNYFEINLTTYAHIKNDSDKLMNNAKGLAM